MSLFADSYQRVWIAEQVKTRGKREAWSSYPAGQWRYGLKGCKTTADKASLRVGAAVDDYSKRIALGEVPRAATRKTVKADCPVETVRKARAARQRAESAYRKALHDARAAGVALADIGRAAGVSRQAVSQLTRGLDKASPLV